MPTVLIVDDDPKLLKMLQRTLVYENLNVLTATNGLEALPLVTAHAPDMIILDWMMPKMDGMTFVQRLRDEENQTMILMLTARDAIENRVEGLESGADDYLVKPFAPAELVARVHAMLRRVEAKPENRKVSYADVSLTRPRMKRGAAICCFP
jgi:two-component system response regulator MprA